MSWHVLDDPSRYPAVTVEIDLNGPTLGNPNATPNWADITDYVRQISTRGCQRQSIFDRFSAGTLDLTLDNLLRRFDPTYAGVVNLLTNPSFETDLTGWAANGSGTLTRDTTKAKFGSASLKVVTGGVATYEGAVIWPPQPGVALAAGSAYTYSVWLWVPVGHSLQAWIDWRDISTNPITSSAPVTLAGNGDWQQIKITDVAPVGAAGIAVGHYTPGVIDALTYWIDGAQFELGSKATPFVGIPYGLGLGTFGSLVTPGTKLRVRETWAGVTTDLITVYIDGAPQEWPGVGTDALVRVGGTDIRKPLNLVDLGMLGTSSVLGRTFDATSTFRLDTTQDVQATDGLLALASWPKEWPDPASLNATYADANFWLLIDSEWVRIADIGFGAAVMDVNKAQASRDSSPVFLGMFRGDQGTTAALHARGAGVQRAGLPAESSDNRVKDVLRVAGFASALASAESGLSNVVKIQPGSDLSGTMALSHLEDVVDTENGVLFTNGSGQLVFQNRHHRFLSEVSPACTFGEGGGRNLLYGLDPSFEGTASPYWADYWGKYNGGGALVGVSGVAADGSFHLEVPTDGVNRQGFGLVPFLRVAPKTTYCYSAYVNMNSGQQFSLIVEWYDEAGGFIGSVQDVKNANGTLARWSTTFTTPANAAKVKLYVIRETYNTGGAQVIVVDALQLERSKVTPFQASFEVPYEDGIVLALDEDRLWTEAKITCSDPSSTVKVQKDDAAITKRGRRTYEKTVLTADTNEGDNAAGYIVNRYSTPNPRFDQIVLQPVEEPDLYWPQVFALTVSKRVRVKRVPKVGSAISLDNYVEGVPSHDITPDSWKTTLTLSDVERDSYWVLGDPLLSVLGDTTRLGY